MPEPRLTPGTTEPAERVARVACERAGVVVRGLDGVAEFAAAAQLFAAIWGKRYDLGPPINADLLRALSHAGNYVSGAFDGRGLQGVLVGFLGPGSGELHLHSHILGVVPGQQARGIGFALKLHQRSWAIDHGLATIEWTFDPLVRRNGYFNLTKLGGSLADYLVNFYGLMDDQQNHQDDSDRVLLRWDLGSRLATAAAAGNAPDPLGATGHTVPFRGLQAGADGAPVVTPPDPLHRLLLMWVPADIVKMRADSPAIARQWRMALRQSMLTALEAGYRCEGMSKAGEYVFQAPPGS